MEFSTVTLFFFAGIAIINFVILYYLIKGAVKNGMIEANKIIERDKAPLSDDYKTRLKQQYERGELTMEEYSKKFNE